MIKEQIQDAIKQAMRERDQPKLDSLRYLISQIKNVEIDAHRDLDDQEVLSIIQKEIKRRKDAIDQYKSAGRQDIVDKESEQLKFIEAYGPKLMSEDEISSVIGEILDSGIHDFPMVMSQVMKRVKGKADGSTVNRLVKEKLSSTA